MEESGISSGLPNEVDSYWDIIAISDEAQFLETLKDVLAPLKVGLVGVLSHREALTRLQEAVFHALVFSTSRPQREQKIFLQKVMEMDESLPVLLFLERWEHLEMISDIVRPMTWTVLTRPRPADHIRIIIQTALERIRLQRELHYLRHRESYIHGFDRIVGNSPQIQKVLRLIKRVARSDATLLIQGESGTGKELIAAAVHFNSHRKDGPFVAVNCAALHENLLESELFGHEKGAFTGADRKRIGRFEQANSGTLFLDEVGDMSPAVQAKVLRVIQDKSFERLGGSQTIRVNVRILAATNQDLRKAIKEKRFREDLYYRVSVVPIYLPPLRDRPEDIVPIVEFFLKKYRGKEATLPKGFHPEALSMLRKYHWPGNIRELENVIERAVLVCRGELISTEDLMLPTDTRGDALSASILLPPGGVDLDEVEKHLILQALERTHGIQKKAAQLLSISPRAMHYKIQKHAIRSASVDE